MLALRVGKSFLATGRLGPRPLALDTASVLRGRDVPRALILGSPHPTRASGSSKVRRRELLRSCSRTAVSPDDSLRASMSSRSKRQAQAGSHSARRGAMRESPAGKTCARCGRSFDWRRAWARDWDAVKYCSAACRARRSTALDADLEAAILALLAERAQNASICPSEAARRIGGESRWRALMAPARSAARRLVARGAIEITQRGAVVDPSSAKGPVRLRLARGSSS